MVYLTAGQLNLHKSNIVAGDFVRYLHDLTKNYRLTEFGSVKGMDHYGVISKPAREKQLLKIKQFTANKERKNRPLNVHAKEFIPNKLIQLAREGIPASLETPISSLWNMDLMECLQPFPQAWLPEELCPTREEIITLEGKQYNLASMSDAERATLIEKWQISNHSDKKDTTGPAGFIFALQEPWKSTENGKLGVLTKTGHSLHYDKSADLPRAAILVSKSLNIWMEPDLTDADMVTCKYLTGIPETPVVYIVSLYCDIKKTTDIVPKKLKSLLRRCKKNNEACLIYGDLNAHSPLWGSPEDNPRGVIFENELIRDFQLEVLNTGNEPTYYGGNTTHGTHIDVSMCTSNIAKLIRNWTNRDAVPVSDHTLLDHTLLLGQTLKEEYRTNYRKAKEGDWCSFRHSLENSLNFELPDEGTYEQFNEVVDLFYKRIYKARDENLPKTKVNLLDINKHARGDTWFTKKCRQKQKRVRAIRSYIRKLRESPLPAGKSPRCTMQDLTEARKSYWKEVKKAKRQGYKDYIENAEGCSAMSKFNQNFIKEGTSPRVLELFNKADGTQMTPEETLESLADAKFPGCRNEEEQAPFISAREAKESQAKYSLIEDSRADFITLEKTKASIESFGSHKGMGSDDIPPVIYKNFGPKAWNLLVRIYKATFLMGLVPKKWLDVKVIFIPKHGKKKYNEPGSWRPISLMQHMQKGGEKLAMWDNEGKVEQPLHLNQHGFRKSRSCMSSVSSLVGKIERPISQTGFALVVFLDIKGAFDYAKNSSIMACLKARRGTRDTSITWFEDFLVNRNIQINMKDVNIKKYCAKGTPQGSTASPYFWNLIADELHEDIAELEDVTSEGFADDTVLIAQGHDVHYIQHVMQKALEVCEKWQNKHGLHFAANKTVPILFTRKTKYEVPAKLILNGEEVEYQSSHKHLGVYLNSRLDSGYHIHQKIRETKGVICRTASRFGKVFGLPPGSAKWLYNMVGRPIVSYGSIYGCKAVHPAHPGFNGIRRKLASLQRFGLMTFGYCRAKTPGAALEVITNTLPLDLYIMYDATCSYIRTRGHEKHTLEEMETTVPSHKGHRQLIVEYAAELGYDHLLGKQVDNMSTVFNWDKGFTVDKASFDGSNPKKGVPNLKADCNIYTDGSRLGEYRSGAAMSVWKKHTEWTREVERPIPNHDKTNFYLEDSSIFHCEVFGVKEAAKWLVERSEEFGIKSATINVDSQACIKALDSYKTKSKLVYHTIQLLNEASNCLDKLTIRWIKAHLDDSELHRGNAFADAAAKLGAVATDYESLVHPDDIPLPSLQALKSQIFDYFMKEWNRRWIANAYGQPPCRQTKLVFPTINPKKSFEFTSGKSRYEFSTLIHAITGHNHLPYHEHVQNRQISPTCTICKIEGSLMTLEHLITECEAFGTLRLEMFGTHNPQLSLLKANEVARFIRTTNVGWLPADEG